MKQERSYISSFRILAEVVVFAIIVFFGYKFVEKRYTYAASQNTVNVWTKSRYDEFYALPTDSLDMVFIGSSHSYCTFDPEIFDTKLGISSWQLGTPAQNADTSLYVLKEVLKTQKPKTVVLELYWDCLDDDFDMKQANSFFEVVKDKNVVNDYIKNVFPLSEQVKYKLAPVKYQQDYFAYESKNVEKAMLEKYGLFVPRDVQQTNGEEYYRSKGYTYCNQVIVESELNETNQYKGMDASEWKISTNQLKYIEEFSDICKQNDIELIFVTAPVAEASLSFIKDYENIHNAIQNIANKLDVKYIDYNVISAQENLLKVENFRDDAHLNHSGVEILDEHFINWLIAQQNT